MLKGFLYFLENELVKNHGLAEELDLHNMIQVDRGRFVFIATEVPTTGPNPYAHKYHVCVWDNFELHIETATYNHDHAKTKAALLGVSGD